MMILTVVERGQTDMWKQTRFSVWQMNESNTKTKLSWTPYFFQGRNSQK